MDFEQLQHAWAQQPSVPQEDEGVRLRAVIDTAGRLQRRTRWRDYVELATAIGLAGVFVWIATLAPVAWPWFAAAGITLGVGLVFVRERARVTPPVPAATDVRRGLELAIEQVDHQIRLLGSVTLWYLAPLGVVVVLVLVGALLGVKAEVSPEVWARGRAGFIGAFAGVMPIIAGLFWFVWWLNRRAVRAHLLPHRDELVRALAQLSADEEQDQGEIGR